MARGLEWAVFPLRGRTLRVLHRRGLAGSPRLSCSSSIHRWLGDMHDSAEPRGQTTFAEATPVTPEGCKAKWSREAPEG